MNQAISPEAAYRQLAGHPAWVVERGRIYRDLRLGSFRDAISFIDRVAEIAERRGHHPNLSVHEWCFARVELYSHLLDSITQADVDFARAVDDMLGEPGR